MSRSEPGSGWGSGSGSDDVLALARAVGSLLAGSGFVRQAVALGALAEFARSPQSVVHPPRRPGPGAGGAATATRPGPTPPVVDHLHAALRAATGADDVVVLLRAVAPSAPWTRTASYLGASPSPGLPDRYAHATLLGPPDGGPTAGSRARDPGSSPVDEVALGLLLLAPGTHYPPHRHPADEVYLPLADATWLDPGGDYAPVPAGVLRHHRQWQPHAMRTGTEPLLAAYVWTGDVRTPSQFCPAPSDSPA